MRSENGFEIIHWGALRCGRLPVSLALFCRLAVLLPHLSSNIGNVAYPILHGLNFRTLWQRLKSFEYVCNQDPSTLICRLITVEDLRHKGGETQSPSLEGKGKNERGIGGKASGHDAGGGGQKKRRPALRLGAVVLWNVFLLGGCSSRSGSRGRGSRGVYGRLPVAELGRDRRDLER